MNIDTFHIPQPLVRVIAALPATPPSFVFSRVLNLVLRDIVRRGDLQALHGKRIAIWVTDTGLHLHFTVTPDGFSPVSQDGVPDLAISATMHDFYRLATRQEDPDTLFFNRRLVVEGDTELGLVAKNTLDGIELPSLGSMLQPGRLLAHIGNWIRFG